MINSAQFLNEFEQLPVEAQKQVEDFIVFLKKRNQSAIKSNYEFFQNNENYTISIKTAYMAMFRFLENEYTITKSNDIGSLLGSMSLLENGHTVDPSAWTDWLKSIEDALNDKCDIKFRILNN